MKKIILFALLPLFAFGQNISVDIGSIRGSNVELIKRVLDNRNIKGSPYLEDSFSETTFIFANGTKFKGMMRYNMDKELFEYKSIKDNTIYELKLKPGLKVTHLGKHFESKVLNPGDKQNVATFEVVVSPQPYGLYLFHKKVVQQPRKESISMPSSNMGDNKDPFWSLKSYMILVNNNQVFQLGKSHKKVSKSGLVDPVKYKKITSKYKYKLDKVEDVKNLVEELNKQD